MHKLMIATTIFFIIIKYNSFSKYFSTFFNLFLTIFCYFFIFFVILTNCACFDDFWGRKFGAARGALPVLACEKVWRKRCERVWARGKTCVERRFNANFRPCDAVWADEAATVAASHGAL